jgi:hypothetical protein
MGLQCTQVVRAAIPASVVWAVGGRKQRRRWLDLHVSGMILASAT